ncbi:hypothetical protein R80B4_02335 [Fibrobacteres bacterium R8-0-B4]
MNQILYMQAGIAILYMKKRNLSPKEFLKLDKKIDILGFIREGYDVFHLMGDQGILDEIEGYVYATTQESTLPAVSVSAPAQS